VLGQLFGQVRTAVVQVRLLLQVNICSVVRHGRHQLKTTHSSHHDTTAGPWHMHKINKWHSAAAQDIDKPSAWLPIIFGWLSDSAYLGHENQQLNSKAISN